MNFFDFILILVVLTTLWFSYRAGAISLIAGLAGKIIIVLGAWYFASPLAHWAGPKFGILPWLMESLENSMPASQFMSEAEMGRVTAQKLPGLLDGLNLPPILKFKMMETIPKLAANGSASVVAITQELTYQISIMVLTVLAFILILIFGKFLLKFIIRIFDLLLGGSIIGFFNRILGMGLGLFILSIFLLFLIGLTAPWILTSGPGEKELLIALLKGSFFYPRILEFYAIFIGNLIIAI